MRTTVRFLAIFFVMPFFIVSAGQQKELAGWRPNHGQQFVTFDSVQGYRLHTTGHRSPNDSINSTPMFDPHTFERQVDVHKKIYREHQRAERLHQVQQQAGNEAAARRNAGLTQLKRATIFGTPTRMYTVPSVPQSINILHVSRSTIVNVLINGEENDTIMTGESFTLSFSFAPGCLSAVMNVFLDADHNGVNSDDDFELSKNILMLDNSDLDEDQAAGSYRVSFTKDDVYSSFVTTMFFEINNFQSITSASLTVLQKPDSAILIGSIDPPFPNIVIRVETETGEDTYVGTDSSGHFSVSVNRTETHNVELYLFDFLGVSNGYIVQIEQGKWFPITGDTTFVELQYLPATSFVEGYVRDQTGAGIPQSGIMAWVQSLLFTRTDSIGYYKIGVTPDQYGKVEILLNEFETNAYLLNRNNDDDVPIAENSTVRKDFIHAKANRTITGRVAFDGNGVGGVPIAIYSDSLMNVAISLEDGTYSVPAYMPAYGNELYTAYVPYLSESYSSIPGYYVSERYTGISGGTGGVDFRIQRLLGGVEGRITDSRTGKSIAGATVYFSGPIFRYCESNDSGYFRVSLSDGTYSLTVYADGYYSYNEYEIQIAQSMVTKNIGLTRSGSFSGTVKDELGHSVYATVYAVDSTGYVTWYYDQTDGQGAYSVSGLPTAQFTAVVEATGYIRQWYDGAAVQDSATYVQITEGYDTPNIDFVLSKGGSISGRTMDRHGIGIPDVWIDVYDTVYSIFSFSLTSESGDFTVSGLPSGTYFVHARHSDYAEQWYNGASTPDAASLVTVVIHENTPDINFTLLLGSKISGTVTAKGIIGNPYAEIIVTDSMFTPLRYGYTFDSENYSIGKLESGAKYFVNAFRYGYARQWYDNVATPDSATPIILAPEEHREHVDFTLRLGGSISGKVLTAAGYPAFITVCDTVGNFQYSGYQDIGAETYTITGIASGIYRVMAYSYGNGYREQWYDHKPSLQKADNVKVVDETTTGNVDFDLTPLHSDSAITVFLEMAGMPDSLIFSSSHINENYVDYWWGIRFDTDNNPATGLNGYDIEIAAIHSKNPGEQEFTATLVNGTRHVLMEWIGNIGYQRHGDVTIRFDETNKKKLILSAPKVWTELFSITPGTKFYCHGAHRSSSGWYEDMTALETVTPSVFDPTGDVPYSFIDIVAAGWDIMTGVVEQGKDIPRSFALDQNYPNPFNSATVIHFQTPAASHVTMKIFDLLGREVKTVVNEIKDAGTYTVQLDASNLASGIYFYRVKAGIDVQTKKMILLR